MMRHFLIKDNINDTEVNIIELTNVCDVCMYVCLRKLTHTVVKN
jgi:hypothetical protein